jgi:hypothetical protein
MTTQTTATIQHVMTGATLGGGALEWMTVNSSAVTALAVCITAITSIALGIWNARSNSMRNKINKRDITSEIVLGLRNAGKSDDYINDLLTTLRM